MSNLTNEYKKWLTELKSKIRSVQVKAAIAVNSTLIGFYWELGKMIAEKETVWGSKLIEFLVNLKTLMKPDFIFNKRLKIVRVGTF